MSNNNNNGTPPFPGADPNANPFDGTGIPDPNAQPFPGADPNANPFAGAGVPDPNAQPFPGAGLPDPNAQPFPGAGLPDPNAQPFPGAGMPDPNAQPFPGAGMPDPNAQPFPGAGTPDPNAQPFPGTGTPDPNAQPFPGTGTPDPNEPDVGDDVNPYASQPTQMSSEEQAEPQGFVPGYYVESEEETETPADFPQENESSETATIDDGKAKKKLSLGGGNKYNISKEVKGSALAGAPDFSKRNINLVTKLVTWSSPQKALPVFFVSMILIGAFSYFGVMQPLEEQQRYLNQYATLEAQVTSLNTALKNYDEISLEYTVYSEEWMTPTELEVVPILQIIPVFEQHLLEAGRVESFSVSNNVLSVTISGISVSGAASLMRGLEMVNIVEDVKVSSAASTSDDYVFDESGMREDEFGNLYNEQGYLVNSDNELIDEHGNVIVIEPQYDEDGNEIEQVIQSKEAGIVMTVSFIKVDPEEEVEEEDVTDASEES